MGDTAGSTQPHGDSSGASLQPSRSSASHDPQSGVPDRRETVSAQIDGSQAGQRAFPTQYSSPSAQQGRPQDIYPQQHPDMAQLPGNIPSDPYRMSPLGAALPDVSYQTYPYPQQRYAQGPPAPGMVYQLQAVPQLAVPPGITPQASTLYNAQYQPQYQAVYPPNHPSSPPQPQSGTLPGSQFYQSGTFLGQQPQQQPGAAYYYQPNQYGAQNQVYGTSPSSVQYGGQVPFSRDNRNFSQQPSNEYHGNSGRTASVGSGSIGKIWTFRHRNTRSWSPKLVNPLLTLKSCSQYPRIPYRSGPSKKTSTKWYVN